MKQIWRLRLISAVGVTETYDCISPPLIQGGALVFGISTLEGSGIKNMVRPLTTFHNADWVYLETY